MTPSWADFTAERAEIAEELEENPLRGLSAPGGEVFGRGLPRFMTECPPRPFHVPLCRPLPAVEKIRMAALAHPGYT
jgi:hypothetical protein